MSEYTVRFSLVIGNKSYSSWSLRAWLPLRYCCGKDSFQEIFCELAGVGGERRDEAKQRILNHSPSGKVPALIDHKLNITVWDSIAINLHIAECYPSALLIPRAPAARAICYSACAEMHSGFTAIRSHMPMNCVITARTYGASVLQRSDVNDDIQRLGQLWTMIRSDYGVPYESEASESSRHEESGYLFGHFTIADCMFAPVALRFQTYDPDFTSLSKFPIAETYLRLLLANAFLREWIDDAFQEGPELKLPQYELGDKTI
jgi:glutathione S-transferase